MMTDDELLGAAAKAAGYQLGYVEGCDDVRKPPCWNPLTDDGDALALAVQMEMDLFVRAGRWSEAVRPMGSACKEPHNGEPRAATRRAIVRAAAASAPHALADTDWRAKPHQPLPDRRKAALDRMADNAQELGLEY
jgi:hypothetical protein